MKTRMITVAAFLLLGAVWGLTNGEPMTRSAVAADKPAPAPEFTGITSWVNSKEIRLTEQKGKVVVLHFWTNGCINCIHNYPHYRAWQDRYKDNKDYLMVGVHTPEFDAERDLDRLKDRLTKNKLTFAVAMDNAGATWKAWGNRYWPCVYLIDKSGNVRERWEGELGDAGYKSMTETVDKLLNEPTPEK